jgi:NADPH-dependent ferric siderophore reductase
VDPEAESYLLAGDETALPAIAQLLPLLPPRAGATVIVELTSPDAVYPLAQRDDTDVRWIQAESGTEPGSAMVAAVTALEIRPGTQVWVAGEAAAVHRLRRHMSALAGIERSDTTIRGYWKRDR